MKCLIVEDNQAMRRVLRRMISDLAEVHECQDGAEALAAYRLHQPDWVLMDIRMRMVHGLDATRQIRAQFPEARVIVVSNYDSDELREAARSAGACGYVLKENLVDLRRLLALPRDPRRFFSSC